MFVSVYLRKKPRSRGVRKQGLFANCLGRREREPPLPSLCADLGNAVGEDALCQLVAHTSRRTFEHVRSSLHRLDMARELIASGCSELQLAAPALAFSLTVRHGPFDDT